jgi:CubicO group peptidase (beta-lactamase class C family)
VKTPSRHPIRALSIMSIAAAVLVAAPAVAASASPSGDRPPTRMPSAREVAGFFDTALPGQLAANHVPGAVVSVVSGGKTIFSKGYGLADVERRTPFDPNASLVRIASITKLFTWTAVMQQVEQGKLDLHADVNRYLDSFHIPATYRQPITLEHLMNHTSGFEDSAIGVGSRSKADVPPLGTFLAEHIPARIRPPGQVSSYSNYGAALAGYIVSRVSGQPYDQYVQDHILTPLGMRHSTAAEPVPAALAAGQAHSYEYAGGAYTRKPFVFDNGTPDGSVSASANDMANFAVAHLQNGRFGDHRILGESTARLMHRRSFAADPRLDGYAHGFKEQTLNGHRVIAHDGNWEAFESALLLVPDAGLGLFISTNSPGGIDAVTDLLPDFFDRFLPGTRTVATAGPSTTGTPPTPKAGFYKLARTAESTVEKLLTLTTSLRMSVDGSGKPSFKGKKWTQVAPGLYQEDGGSQRMAFVKTATGATYLVTDGSSYQRVPWWDSLPVNLIVVVLFILIALTTALGMPLAAAIRRLRKRPSNAPRTWRAGRILAGLSGAIGLAFVVFLTLDLVGGTSVLYGVPTSVRVLLLLPPLFIALTIAATAATARAWRQGNVGVLTRVHQVILLAGMLGLTWFCLHWNLLGWRFG